MNTMTDNYLTPDALAVIERAKALAPKLAARAQQADREGKISDETVQEMAEAGLFRVLQPKRWGGYEMDPRVFYSVQMELAKGCMSTAWIYGVVGVHPGSWRCFPRRRRKMSGARTRACALPRPICPPARPSPWKAASGSTVAGAFHRLQALRLAVSRRPAAQP